MRVASVSAICWRRATSGPRTFTMIGFCPPPAPPTSSTAVRTPNTGASRSRATTISSSIDSSRSLSSSSFT